MLPKQDRSDPEQFNLYVSYQFINHGYFLSIYELTIVVLVGDCQGHTLSFLRHGILMSLFVVFVQLAAILSRKNW